MTSEVNAGSFDLIHMFPSLVTLYIDLQAQYIRYQFCTLVLTLVIIYFRYVIISNKTFYP